MKTAVLAFCLAITSAFAQRPVTPPPQPTSGPGGTDYPHAAFAKSGPFGRGGDAYYLYEPAQPTPASAPVVVFLHGYNGVDPSTQEGWIGHLARKGHIVIFPVYQDGPTRAQTYTGNAKTAIKQALRKLKRGSTEADTQKFAIVGYSLGATIGANIAGSARQSGLPDVSALFVAHAGDTNVQNPSARPIMAPPSKIPDMLLLGVVGNDDDFVGDAYTKKIVEGATKVPGSRKNLIRVFSDDTGTPHSPPTTSLPWEGHRPRTLSTTLAIGNGPRPCSIWRFEAKIQSLPLAIPTPNATWETGAMVTRYMKRR